MNNITFSKAKEELAESYWHAVHTVAIERKFLASTEGFPMESTIEFVKMMIDRNFPQFFALNGSQVVGWCDILPKSFEGMTHVGVLGIGLVPEFRRNNIGAQLLNMAIDHSKQHNNIEKVELEVFKSNSNAIHFFSKHNFSTEGERIKSRRLDGKYDNILCMGKFI